MDDFGLPIYPEHGGIVCWGSDQNGAQYDWDTSGADPDRWTIAITGRSVDPPERHPMTLTDYLDALVDGSIPPAAFEPGEWPRSGRRDRVSPWRRQLRG